MARAKTAVAPPRAALPAHEENRYLAKVKTSLARRWSHTRMKELYEQADLARYLWALDREAEALDVLRSVTSAVPPPGGAGLPNYNVWSPVVTMNALEARICRLDGDEAGAAAPVSRLMADPGLAPNRDHIAAEVAEAPSGFADANAETSVKWACHKLSRKIGGLTLLCELGVAGHPYGDWYDVEETDRLIATGRALLAARLAMTA
ncbi:hypothetical protein [Actinoallomurus iriomotensis]|uniref:Uncharacterized protein n=1 Tax=Actinoallomurus iriomotensis TaxID=478107 RepID=A0A9W6RGH6_9ACTN|nr:hypothetical protein [Actinoallomurus iriomotensis]GLY73495.1 hypothetical protein Airi01_017620 [Actinoallomurus iriomotensis]